MKKDLQIKNPIIKIVDFNFYYQKSMHKVQILKKINLKIAPNQITTIIGRTGCGKSTLLWSINRLNELKSRTFIEGQIFFKNISIYDKNISLINLRKKIGLVFQEPTPFPMSIYNNLSLALKISSKKTKPEIYEDVKSALIKVNLWNDVQDRLHSSALELSGGQQQKLSIARCIINKPDVILMDEPTSSLDPISREIIEALILQLKKSYTIILVTHSLSQASKISDYVVYLDQGMVIEFGRAHHIFTQPQKKLTEQYIRGVVDN